MMRDGKNNIFIGLFNLMDELARKRDEWKQRIGRGGNVELYHYKVLLKRMVTVWNNMAELNQEMKGEQLLDDVGIEPLNLEQVEEQGGKSIIKLKANKVDLEEDNSVKQDEDRKLR
jgi:hypothetical protein